MTCLIVDFLFSVFLFVLRSSFFALSAACRWGRRGSSNILTISPPLVSRNLSLSFFDVSISLAIITKVFFPYVSTYFILRAATLIAAGLLFLRRNRRSPISCYLDVFSCVTKSVRLLFFFIFCWFALVTSFWCLCQVILWESVSATLFLIFGFLHLVLVAVANADVSLLFTLLQGEVCCSHSGDYLWC